MIADVINLPRFRYRTAQVTDLKALGHFDEKGKLHVGTIAFEDMTLVPTNRFWISLCARFGFGPSIFRYFSHEEVFERISQKSQKAQIRLAIQETPSADCYTGDGWAPQLLAVGSDKSIIKGAEAIQVLNNLRGVGRINYRDGRIISEHSLSHPFSWKIGPDLLHAKFVLECPVDGYGKPMLYLMFLREANQSAIVARTKAFRSGVILSKNAAAETLLRSVESFNNEQGFVGLRDRLASAQGSWASVYEVVQLSKIICRLSAPDFSPKFIRTVPEAGRQPEALRNTALRTLYARVGNLREIYGLANLDSVSEKQMRMAASKATVYDLICFASELSTHQVGPGAAMEMQQFVGQLLGSDIYDLEGSCAEFPVFDDFLNENTRAAVVA